MTTAIIGGPRTWEAEQDECGYRQYKVSFLIQATTPGEGPASVLQTPGLPVYGSFWVFTHPQGGSDVDVFAWCRWDSHVKPVVPAKGESNFWFEVEKTFSTKPTDPRSCACRDLPFQDPLLEPPKISGGFQKFTEEATHDRWGANITSSSFEQMRGPHVEFDRNRDSVQIEMNVPLLNLPLVESMKDCVNKFPLWGMSPRQIKLSEFHWERKFWGPCTYYYTWTLGFEVRNDGFDRDLPDESNMVRDGDWSLNNGVLSYVCKNPSTTPPTAADMVQAKDKRGENIRILLDGKGRPANTPLVDPIDPYVSSPGSGLAGGLPPASIRVEKYLEADFSLLGIPLIL